MKIHIVKKGDTLWKIAEMYEVDFEELKQMNAHLAHPDMIMPGMKIRIPIHKKESIKETNKEHMKDSKDKPAAPKKETQKTDQPTKPIEQVKEDDHKDYIHIQPVIPFEQQKSPSLNKSTMPKMPSMPELPHISPVKEEQVKEKEETKEKPKEKTKEKPKGKPAKKEKTEKKEVESFPLTSHGCNCYCGTCTPMHFAEAQMVPQQQHLQMMYPNHGCGCQQLGMYGNYMHHPMVQGTYMQHMYPPYYQMMGEGYFRPQMMHEGMYDPMGHPYSESNQSMNRPDVKQHEPQQGAYLNDTHWQREERHEEDGYEYPSDEGALENTYPPMYTEDSILYSYPDPPEITED